MKPLEKTFTIITAVCTIFSVQMLVDVPNADIPDIKDVVFLFPKFQEEAISYAE